jgi:hypothetical protein
MTAVIATMSNSPLHKGKPLLLRGTFLREYQESWGGIIGGC